MNTIKNWAEENSALAEVLAPNAAPVKSSEGKEIAVDGRQNGEPSVTYDAVVVVDGDNFDQFKADGVAKHYVLETYKHLKPIVLLGDKSKLLEILNLKEDKSLFVCQNFSEVQDAFKKAIQQHRNWKREEEVKAIPA